MGGIGGKNVNTKILEDYLAQKSRFEKFAMDMNSLVHRLISTDTSISIHAITSRVKEYESLEEKINRKSYRYSRLESVTDIVGIRVIVIYASDLSKVEVILQREFNVDSTRTTPSAARLSRDSFGYQSGHFIVGLSPERLGHREYMHYTGLVCEIQVRTLVQHAWAEVFHDLGYKNPDAIPKELIRGFNRISALLEIADQEFDRLKIEIHKYGATVKTSYAMDKASLLINKDTLSEFLADDDTTVSRAASELSAILGVEIASDDQYLVELLVRLLAFVGIHDIGTLETTASESIDVVKNALRNRFEAEREKFSNVRRTLVLLYVVYYKLAKEFSTDDMIEFHRHGSFGDDEKQWPNWIRGLFPNIPVDSTLQGK